MTKPTEGFWFRTTPPAVTLIVATPATVDAAVKVATPAPFVVPLTVASVAFTMFPAVFATVTATPGTTTLFASRTVTVIVDFVTPSANTPELGEATADEFAALGAPTGGGGGGGGGATVVKVTDTVC